MRQSFFFIMLNDFSKSFITLGAILIIFGIAAAVFSRIPGLGKLPGDIMIKRDNFSFYFPLTTCILISALVSFILFLWNQK